jgi:hypothetical protein
MKNFFANRRGTLLVGGVINLVISSIMVVALLGSPLKLFAESSTVEKGFKEFCKTFFDPTSQKKELATCKAMSGSFVKVLPNGAQSLWPVESLEVLATKKKLGTLNTPSKFRTVWLKQITDQVQRALIRGDKDFMPTLFGFKSRVNVLKANLLVEGDIEERFEAFCDFYYSDEPEEEQEVDVPACKNMSVSFASVVPEDVQDRWPDESLKVLADDDALDGIKTQEDFEKALREAIGDDKEVIILIDQDKDFIPTLFEFESADLDSNP